MDYIILDAGGTAIQYSDMDIVIYGDEQEARDDMMADDILIGISYCSDTCDSTRQYCKVQGVDNKIGYKDFVLREGDNFQDKLKAIFFQEMY